MRLIVAIAGIPERIFPHVSEVEDSTLVGEDAVVGRFRIRRSGGASPSYDERQIEEIQSFFADSARMEVAKPGQRGFWLLLAYLEHPGWETLVEGLFPIAAVAAIPAVISRSGPEKPVSRRMANEFRKSTRDVVDRMKRTLRIVGDELKATNKTPLLLPLEHFASQDLRDRMRTLCHQLGRSRAAHEDLERFRSNFHAESGGRHWRKVPRIGPLHYFVDENDRVFKTPPEGDFHGEVEDGEQHPWRCLAAGRVRLGATYDSRFHYDCEHWDGERFAGSLGSCHGQMVRVADSLYVNISPNDHVRPGRVKK